MKSTLMVGAIAGLALGLLFITLNALGLAYAAQEIAGLAGMAILLLVAQYLVVSRQDRESMHAFPARYFTALFAGVATAVVYGLFCWIWFAVVDTEYLSRFYASYLERARAEAASPAEADQMIAAVEGMQGFIMDPLMQALVQFGTVLAISLLTALLISMFTQPRRPA